MKTKNIKSKTSKVSKNIKPNNLKKQTNKIVVLLSTLIVLVGILIILFVINISFSNKLDYKEPVEIVDANFEIEPINLIDTSNDVVNTSNLNLDDVVLPESELLNQYQVTSENLDELKLTYAFVFNQSMIDSYGFKYTEINDVILEFKDYVLVYDVTLEEVKSIWLIQSYPN